jgi:peptidase YpeB-like protein
MRSLRRAVHGFVALAMCVSTAAVSLPASASSSIEVQPLGLIRVAGGMTIDQAVEMVERRFNARVIRAEARDEGGRTVYVLRLLNDSSRVWVVKVDAATGSVM